MHTIVANTATGDAKYIYDALEETTKKTWATLTAEMAKRTEKLHQTESARRELSEAKQGSKTIIEFADELRLLVKRAYTDGKGYDNDQRNEIALDAF